MSGVFYKEFFLKSSQMSGVCNTLLRLLYLLYDIDLIRETIKHAFSMFYNLS